MEQGVEGAQSPIWDTFLSCRWQGSTVCTAALLDLLDHCGDHKENSTPSLCKLGSR